MKTTIKYIHDPAHGWLEVPMADIETLGIRPDISNCSFIAGADAYLEEDCDAAVYLNALDDQGITRPAIVSEYVEHFDRNQRRF
jgi:hypothetical protein